jgi:hypothetical protein
MVIYWLQPEKKGRLRSSFSAYDLERNDLNLIKTIETLGEKANTEFSKLKIVEIPSGCEWSVDDFDGNEWINISLKIS